MKHPPIARFKSAPEFAAHLDRLSRSLGGPVGCDPEILKTPESPLARDFKLPSFVIGNRFCIHPMEGWDGMKGGTPSEWTLRRWRNFGLSGAKLIFGGEAVAVVPEGRANPHQLCYRPENEKGLSDLVHALKSSHREKFGKDDDLWVGLQLTHSGRFCKPEDHFKPSPRIAQRHPILDSRIEGDAGTAILGDGELDALIEEFVRTAVAAWKIGYHFVDIKHCHGYLLHEILGAKTREGRYGGGFENRTRMLREIVTGIRRDAPGLEIAVRLSAFDLPPTDAHGKHDYNWEQHHFGVSVDDPTRPDLTEPIEFIRLCRELGITMVNVTAGSPYYSAPIQRPAAYPPVDSAESPDDPLLGVIRQIQATAELKQAVPEMPLVGTAYTYLQEYLPHVAQWAVRSGHVDFVGLGRMVLAYPTLPDDVLSLGTQTRPRICRTFSDCTNGPRMGFISGCYPLDPVYKELPEWGQIRERKRRTDATPG